MVYQDMSEIKRIKYLRLVLTWLYQLALHVLVIWQVVAHCIFAIHEPICQEHRFDRQIKGDEVANIFLYHCIRVRRRVVVHINPLRRYRGGSVDFCLAEDHSKEGENKANNSQTSPLANPVPDEYVDSVELWPLEVGPWPHEGFKTPHDKVENQHEGQSEIIQLLGCPNSEFSTKSVTEV